MNLKRIFNSGSVKSIDEVKRIVVAYASTNDWDRYGERFESDAFKGGMEAYLKNPVVLWAHDYKMPPIAKTIGHHFDEKGLLLGMEFAATPFANDVFALYHGGYMNAFSVGFRPQEIGYEERPGGGGEMGAVFKKAELLENSAVPVPANPGALVSKGLMGAAVRVYAPDQAPPADWHEFEAWRKAKADFKAAEAALVADGPAPSLKTTLNYLVALCRTLEGSKVKDDGMRALLVQANNLCRELVYGKGVQTLDAAGEDLDEAQVKALVREYELLSEKIKGSENVTEKDQQEFREIGAMLEQVLQEQPISAA